MRTKIKAIAFPHPPGHGGPGSFQTRFENAIMKEGYQVVYAGDDVAPDLIFIVGGTKRLWWLLKMKLKGVPIIHRLDGLAWLHRRKGFKTFLFGEWGNFLFKMIHGFFADHVVYQSQFVKQWWDKSGWRKSKDHTIIYNGVDLNEFKPISTPGKAINLLCVEGTLDYSPYAMDLLNFLQMELIEKSNYQSLVLYGGFQNAQNKERLHPKIDYRGKVAREQLPSIYQDAVYLSLDVNAACPNTVSEALACGLPVAGYDTGSLKELVREAGKVMDYGGDPWKREYPDFNKLKKGLIEVLDNYMELSGKAKVLSAREYSLEKMVKNYLEIIENYIR